MTLISQEFPIEKILYTHTQALLSVNFCMKFHVDAYFYSLIKCFTVSKRFIIKWLSKLKNNYIYKYINGQSEAKILLRKGKRKKIQAEDEMSLIP